MWFVSVALMTRWMVLVLLGHTCFGLSHLLCAGAISIELFRGPSGRRRPTALR